MAEVTLRLPDALEEELRTVWAFNLRHMRPDVLDRIGWNDWEAFVADVLAHGYRQASEEPIAFLQRVRDSKDPLFRAPSEEEQAAPAAPDAPGTWREFERAYQ